MAATPLSDQRLPVYARGYGAASPASSMTGEPALSDELDPWRAKLLRKEGRGFAASP